MKALVDLNVVLDVILNRQPFFADSAAVWNAHLSSARCRLASGTLVKTGLLNYDAMMARLWVVGRAGAHAQYSHSSWASGARFSSSRWRRHVGRNASM